MKTRSKKIPESSCIKCRVLMKKTRGSRKVVESESEAETFAKKMRTTILVGDLVCSKCVSKYKLLKSDAIKKKKEAKTFEYDLSWINDDSSLSDNTDNDPDFVLSSSGDSDHRPDPAKITKSDETDASTSLKINSSDNISESSKTVESNFSNIPSVSTNLIANHPCLIGSNKTTDSGSSKNSESSVPSQNGNIITNQSSLKIFKAVQTSRNDGSESKSILERALYPSDSEYKHTQKKFNPDSLAEKTFENSRVAPVSSNSDQQQHDTDLKSEVTSLLSDVVSISVSNPGELTKLRAAPDSPLSLITLGSNEKVEPYIPSMSAKLIANQPPTEISEDQHLSKNDGCGLKYNLKRTLEKNNSESTHTSKKSKLDPLTETFENPSVAPVSHVIQQAIANFKAEMASLLADVSTSMATPDEVTQLNTDESNMQV